LQYIDTTLVRRSDMKSRLFVLTFSAILVFGVTAFAHHSFAGSYIEDKTVTLEGKVVQFDIRNPHSLSILKSSAKTASLPAGAGNGAA
jgi:hypothetical protein